MRNDPNKTMRHMAILFIILSVLSPCSAFADKASRLNRQGIEQFKKGDAEQSAQSFTDALVERPDSPELRFNRGTALSSAGNTDEAVPELERSATGFTVPEDRAAAHFNTGNTLAKSGNLDGAIEQYRQAITLDQTSLDYRKNLEITLRQKKQQQQDQQKQQDEDNKQDQQQQNKQEQPQDKKDQQNQQSQNEQQEQNKQQEQQQQDSRPMSPEEAQQILDAMKDEETKAFELKRMMMQEALRPGDDW